MKDDNTIQGLMALLYGELSEEESLVWQKRIEREPELRKEWDQLQDIRHELCAPQDKEVIIPEKAYPSFPLWKQPFFRYAATVVLAFGCLLAMARFSGMQVSTESGGVLVSFGALPDTESVQGQPVLGEQQLDSLFGRFERRIKEQETSLLLALEQSIRARMVVNSDLIQKTLTKGFHDLSQEWMGKQEDWAQLHFTEQQQAQQRYLEALTREYLIYMQQVQESNLHELQQRMLGLELDSDHFQSNTENILENLLIHLKTYEHQ